MHGEFKHRMKGAQDNVVRNPDEEPPARPVVSTQHEHATNNRKKADQQNRDNFSGARGLDFGGVIHKPDGTSHNKKPGNQRDGERTLHRRDRLA